MISVRVKENLEREVCELFNVSFDTEKYYKVEIKIRMHYLYEELSDDELDGYDPDEDQGTFLVELILGECDAQSEEYVAKKSISISCLGDKIHTSFIGFINKYAETISIKENDLVNSILVDMCKEVKYTYISSEFTTGLMNMCKASYSIFQSVTWSTKFQYRDFEEITGDDKVELTEENVINGLKKNVINSCDGHECYLEVNGNKICYVTSGGLVYGWSKFDGKYEFYVFARKRGTLEESLLKNGFKKDIQAIMDILEQEV